MAKLKFQTKELQEQFFRHYGDWSPCNACKIGVIAKHKVFFRGKLPCDILFVGEAPGKTEDSVGLPFVGRAGKVLDELIKQALAGSNLRWGITNIVACRPCNGTGQPNRPPSSRERRNCQPRLDEILLMARPKLYVLLGKGAQEALGSMLEENVVDLCPPAYLARGGGVEHPAFEGEVERVREAISRLEISR